jgi:murein DD-endopeptidase MepM/ murein hydrolase activator NlpD
MNAMSRPRPLILATLLAVALLGLAPTVAHALTTSEAQDQLSHTRVQLERMRERLAAARDAEAGLDAKVRALDARLGSIQGALDETSARIADVERDLARTRDRLDDLRVQLRNSRVELRTAEDRLALQEIAFEQRVVMAYKASDLSYLDVLLGSTSFDDLVRRLRLVRGMVDGEHDLLGELEAARAAVAAERDALSAREEEAARAAAELEEQRAELAALRVAQQQQRDAAYAAWQAKEATLAAAAADIAELERQESRLVEQSQTLASIINGNSGGGHGTGALIWPVNGTVTSGFGYRIHPILGRRIFHTGIDIAASSGTPIWAADGGKIVYAAWMDGYGNVVALDHGGGISTLYAHQSSIAVSYGQTVTKGQVVGYVGSTGYSTGPHLHFEVRVNGNPVDPMGYLP